MHRNATLFSFFSAVVTGWKRLDTLQIPGQSKSATGVQFAELGAIRAAEGQFVLIDSIDRTSAMQREYKELWRSASDI